MEHLPQIARHRTPVGIRRHELAHRSPPPAAHIGRRDCRPLLFALDFHVGEEVARSGRSASAGAERRHARECPASRPLCRRGETPGGATADVDPRGVLSLQRVDSNGRPRRTRVSRRLGNGGIGLRSDGSRVADHRLERSPAARPCPLRTCAAHPARRAWARRHAHRGSSGSISTAAACIWP